MALIIGGVGVPKFKRGTVFGQGNVPLTILCLGFITFIKIDVRFAGVVDQVVASGMPVEEFLVKNSDMIKQYENSAFEMALKNAKSKYESDIEYYKKSTEKYYKEVCDYSQQVSDLEQTLKLLIEFKDKL